MHITHLREKLLEFQSPERVFPDAETRAEVEAEAVAAEPDKSSLRLGAVTMY